jgi:hypothetical protein
MQRSRERYAANVPLSFAFFGKQAEQTACGKSMVSEAADASANDPVALPLCKSFNLGPELIPRQGIHAASWTEKAAIPGGNCLSEVDCN